MVNSKDYHDWYVSLLTTSVYEEGLEGNVCSMTKNETEMIVRDDL